MLLNKIPCLDKGYVSLLDASCTSDKLIDIAKEFFGKDDSKFLRELGSITMLIKCPLFVQLHLSTYNFNIINVPVEEVDAYVPNVGEIGGSSVSDNKDISDNMKATTDALLINPIAYQKDGCDRFVSQVLTPISTYTTIIVQGNYTEWKKMCEQPKLPAPMKTYIKAVIQIANVEWHNGQTQKEN
jgi:hypothetical protein